MVYTSILIIIPHNTKYAIALNGSRSDDYITKQGILPCYTHSNYILLASLYNNITVCSPYCVYHVYWYLSNNTKHIPTICICICILMEYIPISIATHSHIAQYIPLSPLFIRLLYYTLIYIA